MHLPLIIGSIFGLAAILLGSFYIVHFRGLSRRDRETLEDEDDFQRT